MSKTLFTAFTAITCLFLIACETDAKGGISQTGSDARADVPNEMVAKVQANPSNPAEGWGPKDATPGVVLKLREVDRRKRDGITQVTYQTFIEGAPKNKTYNLWFHDLGMLTSGHPPVPARVGTGPVTEYRVDAQGDWKPSLPRIGVSRFVKGEWVELRLISLDGSVRAVATVVPFPIQAIQKSCRVWLRLMSKSGTQFVVSGEGFQAGELVTTVSRSNGEVLRGSLQVDSNGVLPLTLLFPAVDKARPRRTASYTVSGRSCQVTVNYEWGLRAAQKIQ